ncbi:MAG: alginate O-acetyltransferase complex protein AlgI [Pirellulaceae bacterium]|jgi:alginate O-acetyltransferase complex protein AlgI
MLFTQIEFVVFFVALFIFLVAVRSHSLQKTALLIGSYYFYAYWDFRFLALVGGSTIIDYVLCRVMTSSENQKVRKTCLITSLIVNLGALAFFKYYGFFVGSMNELLEPLGWNLRSLSVILPVGISFYTFQTLSYTIDVYRGKLKPCTNFRDFALFVSFFPQLVAGPIVRASDFLYQLETPRKITTHRCFLGFRQFTSGLFKKVLIADNLALFVDEVFGNAGAFDCPTTWLAVSAYALQIYCDFSGYSDMAIGIAKSIGYDLPKNFNLPYIATRIDKFWHRWHISLSSWLRDYLYIPLGGNQKGAARTYINLMLTMVLGGLWHGAAWTFVAWGLLHGVALAITRYVVLKFDIDKKRIAAPLQVLGWAQTMVVVLVAWVLFRSADFTQATLMLRQMFWPDAGYHVMAPFPLFAIGLMAIGHILTAVGHEEWLELEYDRLRTPLALGTMILLVLVYYPQGFQPFVYFQF